MLTSLLVCLGLLLSASPQDSDPEIPLRIGERKVLSPAGVERAAVGDPEVATVLVESAGVVVEGISEGKTSLLTWAADGTRTASLLVVTKSKEANQPRPAAAVPATSLTGTIVTVRKGEVLRTAVAGVARVTLGDPSLADAVLLPGEIEVRGREEGRTTLLLRFADGRRHGYALEVLPAASTPKSASKPAPKPAPSTGPGSRSSKTP
ncbi:MAG: pilus assembly protein N-terminal domain-containing protein [Myxococcales bacterium]